MALSHVMNIISNAGIVAAGTGSGGGGGGASNLDSQTVTVGQSSVPSGGSGAPTGTTVRVGFSTPSGIGSISDGTSNLYNGASILEIKYTWDTTYDISALTLVIDGNALGNSGWTTLTVGSESYQRASASYAISGGDTIWAWPGDTDEDYNGGSSPFGASGTTTTCVFT